MVSCVSDIAISYNGLPKTTDVFYMMTDEEKNRKYYFNQIKEPATYEIKSEKKVLEKGEVIVVKKESPGILRLVKAEHDARNYVRISYKIYMEDYSTYFNYVFTTLEFNLKSSLIFLREL